MERRSEEIIKPLPSVHLAHPDHNQHHPGPADRLQAATSNHDHLVQLPPIDLSPLHPPAGPLAGCLVNQCLRLWRQKGLERYVCVTIFMFGVRFGGVCGCLKVSWLQLGSTRLHQVASGTRPLECRPNPFTSSSTALKRVGRGANLSLSPAAEQTQVPSLPPPLSVLRLTADSQCDFVSL